MAFLQGSSYELPFQIDDCDGNLIVADMVDKASFTIGEITKNYGEEGDEIWFNEETKEWIVPLSEEETFLLDDENGVEWQARFLFVSGKVDGTDVTQEYVYKSINRRKFTGGEENA